MAPILRLPCTHGGCSPPWAPAAGSCLGCSPARRAAAAFVSCRPEPQAFSPSDELLFCQQICVSLLPIPSILKAAPEGRGAGKPRAGREPARPAVSANKVAFTNEPEDPTIMVLIIANIVTGLTIKTSKSSSVNPRLCLFYFFFLFPSPRLISTQKANKNCGRTNG